MAGIRLIENHWYKFKDAFGDIHKAQYIGRQDGFECVVCRMRNLGSNFEFGKNCRTFNVYHSILEDDYETWGFGKEHFPEILEDYGVSVVPIVDD